MRVKFLQLKDPELYAALKILVVGGGCSGFSYEFDVISKTELASAPAEMEDYLLFERDGLSIVSDSLTLDMINGSTIEYVEEMIRSAFEVTENPMADGGCSCGVSFTPKDS
uniref:Core domain-containing protein n=1 Tax=Favella ehrenbergii TaxID=182087 RepID=A0A7S3MLV2_9SPIT|mmetsp:Transcript_43273/g.57248  ORF Transcript_43273/g.57248 Transcript_43273/m.57248 type:complete len:111 (+) Transcript_43273:364-696(+)|eukprot:Macronucleus_8984.p1 GENE.Macronucleus_8984~~Macronucleus_8984.p1  ORF type:complete len:111 (+),score=21.22 Macronucleus_8984:1-333(+)